MGVVLQLNSCYSLPSSSSSSSSSSSLCHGTNSKNVCSLLSTQKTSRFSKCRIRAVGTVPDTQSEPTPSQDPPSVKLAFVSSVLLPDGTPDVHFRIACGGQKLRNIMLENNIELYGPNSRLLLNCAGGGSCGTCMVEVVAGKEHLSPRTDKEKEKLKRNPKSWRLACQTIVGNPESDGLVVLQQLPEWKAHEWKHVKETAPPES